MAFQRPTLPELVERIQADLVSRLDLKSAILRRSVLYVLARVLAGAAHMLHGHLEFLGRQMFPDLSEENYLLRQGSIFGMAKIAPGYAKGVVIFTGTAGETAAAGRLLFRSDGAEYQIDADVLIATLANWATSTVTAVGALRKANGNIYRATQAGTTSAGGSGPTGTGSAINDGTTIWKYVATGAAAIYGAVTAVVPGATGTLTAGVLLTFQSPISGVDSTTTITTPTTDGSDEETTDAFRTRLLERLAEQGNGGSDADWIRWAKSVAGVTRAWVYRQALGPGSVLVRFVRDNDATPIPDVGEVAAVQAVFNLEGPAHATATAFAPALAAQAFTVAVVPDTGPVRDAVQAELVDLYLRIGQPGGTVLISAIRTSIGNATGLTNYTLTIPAGDISHTANQLPTVGAITWV